MPDAKWYASWVRMIPAESAAEKERNLEAADLIESLAAELERVKRERNAAIQDFELVSISLCRTCKNYRKPTAKWRKGSCVELPDASVTCVGSCSWFEWRGVKEDSK